MGERTVTAGDPGFEATQRHLERAGVLFGTPIQRLRRMNEPAYQFYLGKNPYVDLEKDWLEVDVCAQHNNGGLVVDAWWQSNVAGFFPVGEAGGAVEEHRNARIGLDVLVGARVELQDPAGRRPGVAPRGLRRARPSSCVAAARCSPGSRDPHRRWRSAP